MTPYFPEVHGRAYRRFRADLDADVSALGDECRTRGTIDEDGLALWAVFLLRLEDVAARTSHLASYLGCIGAADARDEVIQRETASAAVSRAELEKIFVQVRAALRHADDEAFAQLASHEDLHDVRWFLERLRERARFSMEPELESLNADLATTGLQAWGRLYDQLSGKLEFELATPSGESRRLPVSVVRSLLEDPDPAVRRAALQGSNVAWQSVSDVVASCLNAIAGTRLTLYRRRGIDHFLDPAVFDAAISRETLDTMLEVVASRWELPRAYLRSKARLLGRQRLGFQDLMAPLPGAHASRVGWDAARHRVLDAFGGFHPELADFARSAFENQWIDWEPRVAKRPGGFCSSSPVIGQSRIFMTFNGALGDVATLAHELGHAFHSWVMRDMRPWARRYPMTLAETASTFAEQLLVDAVLSDPDSPADQRASLLDGRMQDASVYLLNIPMRYQFEKAFYQERASGEVPVSRLNELMVEAQRTCYADTLADDELDPWFWASKLHFYITGLSFYNFPYTFGYLFSLGIFALARREGADFLPRYVALLRSTGGESAESVAHRHLGVDLTAPEFWNASLDLLEEDARRFEAASA